MKLEITCMWIADGGRGRPLQHRPASRGLRGQERHLLKQIMLRQLKSRGTPRAAQNRDLPRAVTDRDISWTVTRKDWKLTGAVPRREVRTVATKVVKLWPEAIRQAVHTDLGPVHRTEVPRQTARAGTVHSKVRERHRQQRIIHPRVETHGQQGKMYLWVEVHRLQENFWLQMSM